MLEKLDFLVRYWELQARHASQGEPLDQEEQRELLSLLQLVTPDLKVPEAGPVTTRDAQAVPAQIIGEGVGLAIHLRSVTAAALVATCAGRVAAGAQVIVRATDAVVGVEYALPCTVLWLHAGTPNTIALAVDGVPLRSRFDAEPASPRTTGVRLSGGYERLLTWTTQRRRAGGAPT